MRLNPAILTLVSLAVMAFASESRAQNFFGGNTTAFDPEISIVESGANLDVQATVSHDRKYVTMTARPQVATLIALREFVFQSGAPGIVGMNGNNANINNGRDRNGRPMPAMARPAAPTPVLMREGMHRVDTPTPEPVGKPAGKPATLPAN